MRDRPTHTHTLSHVILHNMTWQYATNLLLGLAACVIVHSLILHLLVVRLREHTPIVPGL